MLVKFISHSSSATRTEGAKLARLFLKNKLSLPGALVISLEGNLGGGKTTFLQGLANELGVKKILSPTFVLLREYSLKGQSFRRFYHFDWYRLDDPQQVEVLGWSEKLADQQNIIAVEWGDKFPSLLPPSAIKIKFKLVQAKERELIINFPPGFSQND